LRLANRNPEILRTIVVPALKINSKEGGKLQIADDSAIFAALRKFTIVQ